MALATPTTITIGATPYSLNKVNQDSFGSTFLYKGVGFELVLKVRHSYETKKPGLPQMERHNIDLTQTNFAADGTQTVMQSYMVMRNIRGVAAVGPSDFAKALSAFVTTNALAVVNWEN